MPSSPIRVALDVSCAMETPLTGVGYAALHQVRALLKQSEGFDLRLFGTPARNARGHLPKFDGFSQARIVPYARRLKLRLWRTLQWPPIEWFSGPVDIAHEFFHQVPAARKALRVSTVHDLSILRRPETHTRQTIATQSTLLRHCARTADACVAVSESCRNDMVELLGMSEDRIFVVPNGVDLDAFAGPINEDALAALKQRLGLKRDYFIHLGTVEPRKNLPRLLEAYGRVEKRVPDAPQLLLVGKAGWMSEPTFDAIRAMGPDSGVVHAGYLDREDALLLLRSALACVYPSLYEGFGLPVLEAMAAKTPVITSNLSSLPEVAGDTCVLLDPENTDAIEAALTDMIEHPEAAQTRAEKAHARAQGFSWAESARGLAQAYRTLYG